MSSGSGKGQGFTVTDKRASSDDAGFDADETTDVDEGLLPDSGDVPPIDFHTFVLSLGTSALMQLGEGPPEAPKSINLPLARQTIDLLALLEEKTRGNLTGEEERLLTHVLFDLRSRYVAKTK